MSPSEKYVRDLVPGDLVSLCWEYDIWGRPVKFSRDVELIVDVKMIAFDLEESSVVVKTVGKNGIKDHVLFWHRCVTLKVESPRLSVSSLKK